eukprot:668752-Prorocentrum_minimum.AAC.2
MRRSHASPQGQGSTQRCVENGKKKQTNTERARDPSVCARRDATGSAPVCRPCARRPGELPRGTYRRAQCNRRRA